MHKPTKRERDQKARLEAAVLALNNLPAIPTLDDIEAVLLEHKITPQEFMELDTHPGAYGDNGRLRDWHPRLRGYRNSAGRNFFERLAR